MLLPKRTKYRKMQKGRSPGLSYRGNNVVFGEYGLMALEPSWISSRQIEAARRAITNYVKRGGKVWIRIFPDKPVTRKPAETRMGGGKGSVDHWVAVVKPGRIMFELAGVRRGRSRGPPPRSPKAAGEVQGDRSRRAGDNGDCRGGEQ